MKPQAPFGPDDLAELDQQLLARAAAVVAMREVHAGNRGRGVIGLRHDVDNNEGALQTAEQIAAWEAQRGYRASFYVLHTAPYWHEPGFRPALERIALLGHEIGIHANALAEALRTGAQPDALLQTAIAELREWGHTISGVVGHGDPLCPRAAFANDEQFLECARPKNGAAERLLEHDGRTLPLRPRPLASFGLAYEAIKLGRSLYLTDSSGRWLEGEHREPAFEQAAAAFPPRNGQLHVVWHPDWWANAFKETPE